MIRREQLQKHWKEIEAFKNGAEIECYCEGIKSWLACGEEPRFATNTKYRVKLSPKWRPFKDVSEVKLGSVVRLKSVYSTWLITGISIKTIFISNYKYTLAELFERFELSLDGGKTFQPCGVLE